MITAIILDGWHAQEVLRLPTVRQVVSLLKPPTITYCDCSPEYPETFAVPNYRVDYKLLFVSVDRKTALYSQSGKSEDVLGWFAQASREHPYKVRETLVFGCHDPKAVFSEDDIR